jgi:hypothetical protein
MGNFLADAAARQVVHGIERQMKAACTEQLPHRDREIIEPSH